MKSRVSVLFAALCFLGSHCQPAAGQPPPQGDDAASFVNDLRARVVEREALIVSAEDSFSKGRYHEAEDTLQNLMARYPSNVRAIDDLARVYIAENRTNAALAFLEGQVAQHPERQDILLTFVRVAVEFHAYDPAIAALRTARKQMPNTGVAVELARVLSASGQEAEATGIYSGVLGVDPLDGPGLLRRASELSEQNGDLDIALACAELARKLLPDSPEASDTLGWLYLKRQQTQMAIPLFRGLVNAAPQVSTYHYHLAMALLQKGDTNGEMSELQSALRCNPPAEERERIQTLMNPPRMLR